MCIKVELVERKLGQIDFKIIPLENLDPTDLNFIKGLSGGMTEEVYLGPGTDSKLRKTDVSLIDDITTQRVMVIKQCVLLWTILQGNLKQRPHLDQLCAWLNETKHTQKGELWLREQDVKEIAESDGPEVLFGESLEEAMKNAPRGGKTIENSEATAIENELTQMSDDDLSELFESGGFDLALAIEEDSPEAVLTTPIAKVELVAKSEPFEVDFEVDEEVEAQLKDEDDVEKALEEFFSPMTDEQPTIWLTEEV
jgi:hypothetical protein